MAGDARKTWYTGSHRARAKPRPSPSPSESQRRIIANMSHWNQWHEAFLAMVQEPQAAEPLKAASLAADMMAWTAHLTTAVVGSCESLGWPAAAREHQLALLPLAGQEYLSKD